VEDADGYIQRNPSTGCASSDEIS